MNLKRWEQKKMKWDTDYFGIDSARVNIFEIINDKQQDDILEFLKKSEFITISNYNNIVENNYWIGSKTDAFLVDVNIQFLKILKKEKKFDCDETLVTNNVKRNEQILSIAKKAFDYSRFFNDPNLPRVKAKNIYHHWTESAFEQDDKYFVIFEQDDNVAGYILFSIDRDSCVIELIAVDGKYQGIGVGKSMFKSMESFVIEKRISNIKVGTQINNIKATKFYYNMGFEYISCSSVYHLWKK